MDPNVENQIVDAITIHFDPQADPGLKAQAFEFVKRLRSEPQAWQVCLAIAIKQPRASEVVRHVTLEVVNNAIQRQQIDRDGLLFIRDNMMTYLRNHYGGANGISDNDPSSVRNKMIQTITDLFTVLYASEWLTIFDEFWAIACMRGPSDQTNALGTELYLKILISVHDHIADVLVTRTPQEQLRDNDLKDLIRQRDATKIAQSWQDILLQWKLRDPTVIATCLSTIGRWSSWTDLSLIIQDPLLNLLFQLIASTDIDGRRLRDIALETISDILGKKMKAKDKLELIEVLRIQDVVAQLIASPSLLDFRPTSNYDTDLAELVAKLVNNTVFDIVRILEDTADSDQFLLQANAHLKTFLPFVLRFFSDEYDEICSSVIPCLMDLLTYFRKKAKTDVDYASMLSPILQSIVAKMRYDETSSWGNEDSQTDEAEFQELRKRLQVLQQAVAAANEQLYIGAISDIIGNAFESFRAQAGQVDWRDIDLALHEMFLFGELAVKNGGLYTKTKPVSAAAERLIDMMFKLVDSSQSPPFFKRVIKG